MTFSHIIELSPRKCVSKCSSDSFSHTKYTSSWVENFENHTLMFCCSPIPGRRFEKKGKLWDRFVPQILFFPFPSNWRPTLLCNVDLTHMVMYILCVKNCQNYILTHSCLPIAEILFYNVRKMHEPRISECNVSVLPQEIQFLPWVPFFCCKIVDFKSIAQKWNFILNRFAQPPISKMFVSLL